MKTNWQENRVHVIKIYNKEGQRMRGKKKKEFDQHLSLACYTVTRKQLIIY